MQDKINVTCGKMDVAGGKVDVVGDEVDVAGGKVDVKGSRELKQITMAGATTAAVTGKVWGEYISVVGQILGKRNTKMSET